MAVETAADRAAMLSSDDWGVVASYTPVTGGAARDVSGIFDAQWTSVEVGGEQPVSSTGPHILVATSDLTNGGRQNDQFVIDGVTYLASDVQPDGTGMTSVMLHKQ